MVRTKEKMHFNDSITNKDASKSDKNINVVKFEKSISSVYLLNGLKSEQKIFFEQVFLYKEHIKD